MLALVLAVAGFGAAEGQQAAGELAAKMDSFRVGDEVYVRALAIDAARNSMWVGTSLGALEIDLESHDVKNTFTREHGLANEYVFAIGIDPAGTVWFGTNAGGASAYDGANWKTYFPMHGLADYWVYAFAFEGDDVWIGTWDGVSRFQRGTGAFTNYREELINIWVYGIDIDRQGRLWFGTEGGVSMLDRGEWSAWTHDDGLGVANAKRLPESANTGLGTKSRHDLSVSIEGSESYNPNYVFAVQTDRLGRGVWFATWGGGVSLFDGDRSWTTYGEADGLAGNIVYSMAQEPDGTLWFGTNRGVSRFDGERWTTYRHGLLASHVYAIALDPDGSVWLGTKGGVTRLSFEED